MVVVNYPTLKGWGLCPIPRGITGFSLPSLRVEFFGGNWSAAPLRRAVAALRMLIAALWSRSIFRPQLLHSWIRTAKDFLTTLPQSEHSWDVPWGGTFNKCLPAFLRSLTRPPVRAALLSSVLTKLPHEASDMLLAR